MKLPITDQFILDLYNVLIEVKDLSFKRNIYMFLPENPVMQKYKNDLNKRKLSKLISYLKKRNLISVKSLKGEKAVLLTKNGIDKALKASFKDNGAAIKRKDGKWIMIIFDIPKDHYKARNLLRSVLQNLGYKLLHHSVWVTPYDVSEKTEESLQYYSLEKYVKIFLIEKL